MPCNEPKCEHWTLLALLPKKKLVLYLDSLDADVVTPVTYRAVSKIASLIKELDKSTDTTQWQFVVNTTDDIKQQANGYGDCGIFTSLYARDLVSKGSMIDVSSMYSFRQLMLLDLHQRRLHSLPSEGIQLEQDYAVDYVSNYYIGRVVHQNSDLVTVKFLHRTGTSHFNWPKTDDIEEFTFLAFSMDPYTSRILVLFMYHSRKRLSSCSRR